MNTFTTTLVEATLGRKLITRADQFFSHSTGCIIDEMIQNSRRAKAKNIQFILDNGDLIIADDGHGLTAENAHILLAAGGSNNDAATEEAERAAGLGFFALAKHDVVVRSHDWEMRIPKEAFIGATAATLTRGFPHQDGLSIWIQRFIGLKALASYEGVRLGETIERCARYSGLTASFKGFPEEVPLFVVPKVFLDHELDAYAANVVAMETETVHGVTLKLARVRGECWRSDKTWINFFGKVISLSDSQAKHQIPSVERVVTLDDEKKEFIDTSYATLVLIDVHDTTHFKLKLPERDVLIKDEGLDLIWKTVDLLYCKMLSRADLVNGLAADHPLRLTSPYPIPSPSRVVSNLAGVRWMPKDGGLVSAEGDRLERHDIVSVALDRHHVQESGYLESMLESYPGIEGCVAVARVMFEETEIEHAFGKGVVLYVTGNALVIKAEGEEIKVALDDGESGDPLTYNDVGGAISEANIDDLFVTIEAAQPKPRANAPEQPVHEASLQEQQLWSATEIFIRAQPIRAKEHLTKLRRAVTLIYHPDQYAENEREIRTRIMARANDLIDRIGEQIAA